MFAKNIYSATSDLRSGKVRFIKNLNGDLIEISSERDRQMKLEVGMTIFRVLREGDRVLLNRLPTLYTMGVRAARVILPDINFNLNERTRMKKPSETLIGNPSQNEGFNGDHDGDEYNLHIPQVDKAYIEMAFLNDMEQMISDYGAPVNSAGLIEQMIVGAYRLTDPEVSLSPSFLYNISENI